MNGGVVANSKLLIAILKLKKALINSEIVICPPHIYIHQVKEYIVGSRIKLGTQNVNANKSGAYTGEISVGMLKDFNCDYALVGHSERRTLFNETDKDLANKILLLVQGGIIPVLCIGESLAQRENGEANSTIIKQLEAVINIVGYKCFKSVVIAYEPIWAIGTGKTASIAQAQAMHKAIREYLTRLDGKLFRRTSVLYGGSVSEKNASDLIKQKDIDGFLVGGASLMADSFEAVCSCSAGIKV